MPFAVAALNQPAAAYGLVIIAIAGLVYAGVARAAFVPGFAGVAAALLAVLACLHEPPSALGLIGLGVGVVLMNIEFVLPTFGCAGAGGIAATLWGSWQLLEPYARIEARLPWRIALAVAGTGLLLAAVCRAWRSRTLPP